MRLLNAELTNRLQTRYESFVGCLGETTACRDEPRSSHRKAMTEPRSRPAHTGPCGVRMTLGPSPDAGAARPVERPFRKERHFVSPSNYSLASTASAFYSPNIPTLSHLLLTSACIYLVVRLLHKYIALKRVSPSYTLGKLLAPLHRCVCTSLARSRPTSCGRLARV